MQQEDNEEQAEEESSDDEVESSDEEEESSGEEDEVVVEDGFTVFIKELTGRTYTLIIGADNTVEDLKTLLNNQSNIPVDQQRLIFSGKQMENDRTMDYYNVRYECTIHLVLRLGGC